MHNLPGYRVLSKARGGISYGKTFQAIQAFVTYNKQLVTGFNPVEQYAQNGIIFSNFRSENSKKNETTT